MRGGLKGDPPDQPADQARDRKAARLPLLLLLHGWFCGIARVACRIGGAAVACMKLGSRNVAPGKLSPTQKRRFSPRISRQREVTLIHLTWRFACWFQGSTPVHHVHTGFVELVTYTPAVQRPSPSSPGISSLTAQPCSYQLAVAARPSGPAAAVEQFHASVRCFRVPVRRRRPGMRPA
jgi:hypothetical protein